MVQLIAVAAIGGVALVAYNAFRKHWNDIQAEELEKAKKPKVVGDLEQDPETGRYKPKD